MYLTYDEYIQFGGSALEETAFEELEFEARAQVDYVTFNRLVNEETLPEPVKRCMYKLISLLHDQQLALNGSVPSESGARTAGIASESNDGVSTSYNVLFANEVLDTIKDSINTTINRYLSNVRNSLGQKVLYRGIYPNE